ncbi:UTRA domain-containing protein [Alteribacillus sp. JSM 102045]|uniref:UTRA domain-containing protein n=1 Tax=Alteribacillus sp. JSM 102045 TaxID=1562101 RepID=UPI0035C217C0
MTKTKYIKIYEDLKKKIEQNVFPYQELLPSENTLLKEYGCSRNTVRRAIAELASKGYVQTKHGQGVRVIYQELKQKEYMFGDVETFKEFSMRHNNKQRTEVFRFQEWTVDESLHKITSFPVGTDIYYLQRVRYLDDKPLIIDHNYFRKDVVQDLTVEITEDSVYEYMEKELNESIVTTKRKMTVEKMDDLDERYLQLNGYNCVAVVTSYTYNADGVMFEYTQSRHKPDYFVFYDQAQRRK